MNDDDHRYGALRESYAFEYAVYEQADKNANTHFDFKTYDTYSVVSRARPAVEHQREVPARIDSVLEFDRRAPGLRRVLEAEAWVTQVKGAFVPNLNVAGFWDQEDPWGPWEIYRRSEASDPNRYNFIVAGPVVSRTVAHAEGRVDRPVSFGGHDTALEFREKIEAPWFRYWLHGKGEKFPWKASTFQTGSNSWKTYAAWPAACDGDECLSARRRDVVVRRPPPGDSYVQYVSDPAKPVPYRPRPISPTYPAGDWRRWEVGDQRFVENRPTWRRG
jgi:hypothetical protein